jgi:hypothetical protein
LSQPHVSTADQADLIGFLQGLPEGRKRRGIRYPQWFLLLVAILGILSGCLSVKDLERFAARHHGALNAVLGLGIKGSPTDSTFLYLFERVDLAELFSMLRSWMLERIASEGREVTQLVCDGKTLRGSAVGGENTAERFVAQVTLYARELGVAIAQTSYDTGDSNERQALRELLSTMDLDGVLIQTDALHTTKAFFQLVTEQGADVLVAVKGNQPRLNRQIKDQFRFRRQFPVEISQSESGHGRAVTWTLRAMEATDVIRESWPETSWILELHSTGSRDGKPFDHRHY